MRVRCGVCDWASSEFDEDELVEDMLPREVKTEIVAHFEDDHPEIAANLEQRFKAPFN